MHSVSISKLIKINKLSPHQLDSLVFENTNTKKLRDLLTRELRATDKGIEVGSDNYISKSSKYFLRSKALQSHSFIPQLDIDSYVPVSPNAFKQFNLQKGDILISKDSNIGETIILDKDYPEFMYSGAMYRLPVEKYKYYILGVLKHSIFRNQLDLMVPKGATIRHAGTKFLDCLIPFPEQDKNPEIVEYVGLLTKAIVEKEIEIKRKDEMIKNAIGKELITNQKQINFKYEYPTIEQIAKQGRLDVGLYDEYFQRTNFLVKNYIHGHVDLISRGFDWSRGTSLEIKGLGTRLDSNTYKEGFYELITPTNISEYGTIISSSFIGTAKKLKTIKKGDIIFGGEGFLKGRSFVVCNDVDNIATNYHGIRIFRKKPDLVDSIFIRCFLAYWRDLQMIDSIGVGGSGGHCAPQYFPLIETPLFPKEVKEEISTLYHNEVSYPKNLRLCNFLEEDSKWNMKVGIFELDRSLKLIQQKLDNTINAIADNEPITIELSCY